MAASQHLRMRVSENNGLPWTQTQEYVNLCRTVSQPGDPTTYNPSHPQGYSSTDVTQFQVGLASLNINNLPDVMYQLWPSKEWWEHTKSARPPAKRDANGNIMYERTPRGWAPRELLDFPILRNLDTISSEEDPWFLEMLLRMDGRIEWTDLLMRMEYPGTTDQDEQKIRNRLQQRMARFRERFTMVSWRDTAGETNAIRDRVLNRLTPAQVAARGGLGSTRGSTPGSMDSQGRVIPLPGRRARGNAAAADRTAQVQQPQAQTVHAGPSNGSIINTGFTPVSSQVHQRSGPYGGSRTSQQNVRINSGTLNRQQQTRPSTSTQPNFSYRINGDESASISATQRIHPSTSYTDNVALQPYSAFSSAVPPPAGTRQGAFGVAHPRMHDDQASPVHARNRTTQQVGNPLYAGSSEVLQVPDGPSTDEEDYGDVDTDDNDDLSEEDRDKEPAAEMPLVEEGAQIEPLSHEVCSELRRYLEDDRARTMMCLDGKISLDQLMQGMQRNQAKLQQGIKRARGEADDDDDDEVEYIQNQRSKRPRRGQGAPGSSSQLRPETQNPIYSGFDHSQPGPSRGYHPPQGPLANSSRRPTARPIGSAVQRLHNDRQRRPAPKATTAQNDREGYLHYHQPDPVIDNEWTVYGVDTGFQQPTYPPQQSPYLPQQSPYLPRQGGSLHGQGVYTNPGQPQRGPELYKAQRDNGVGTSTGTTTAASRPRPSSYSQHQPGSERFRSAQSPTIQDATDDVISYGENSPTEDRNSHSLDSPTARIELHRDRNGNIAPRHAYQHFEQRTAQDDPFFSDELFEGMLNGIPDNNHVGNVYTHAQQGEIDDYYHVLMTPHPRPDTAPNTMPPPPPPPTQPVPEAANSASQPAAESDLEIGDIAGWDPAWEDFVNVHDAETLLQLQAGGNPDEDGHGSPSGS